MGFGERVVELVLVMLSLGVIGYLRVEESLVLGVGGVSV